MKDFKSFIMVLIILVLLIGILLSFSLPIVGNYILTAVIAGEVAVLLKWNKFSDWTKKHNFFNKKENLKK